MNAPSPRALHSLGRRGWRVGPVAAKDDGEAAAKPGALAPPSDAAAPPA